MKPITYLVCYLMVLAYGIYAASVHGTTFAWIIVLSTITVGVAVFVRLGLGFGHAHKISWRRTALHGRIRPVNHRHL